MFLKETLYSIDSLGIFRNIEMVKRLLVYERFFLKYSYSDDIVYFCLCINILSIEKITISESNTVVVCWNEHFSPLLFSRDTTSPIDYRCHWRRLRNLSRVAMNKTLFPGTTFVHCNFRCVFSMTIVVDCGSNTFKVGISNEAIPCAIFEPFLSQTKTQREYCENSNAYFVGNQLSRKHEIFSQISSPIQNGIVNDWQAMEEIFKYIFFDELRVDPKHQTMLVSEPPLHPLKERERMTEMLFEVFHIPALYIASQSMLALYCSGKTTGVVIDSGDSLTSIVPVYEGYTIQNAIQQQEIAGKHLGQYLSKVRIYYLVDSFNNMLKH